MDDPIIPWPENADEMRPLAVPGASWGYLVDDSPFAAIFPDGRVPLLSVMPIVPREAGAPWCYLVDVAKLSEAQIAALAALLWRQWQPECASKLDAAAYIIGEGLPLRTAWFTTVGATLRGITQ